MIRLYTADCAITVREDAVWKYLKEQGKDIEELKKSGYKFTDDDWRYTAEWLFDKGCISSICIR